MGLFIGLMSGTSLDGIDAVLADIDTTHCHVIGHLQSPLSEDIREAVLALNRGRMLSALAIGQLDHQLGLAFAKASLQLLNKLGYAPKQIQAIACHGQTVYHAPQHAQPFTWQLGDANLVAAHTGITTIADFRRLDMAFGGQGAPLVPAFHKAMFGQHAGLTVVLNIGGIANVSILQTDGQCLGFDTGPGNGLLDAWIQREQGLAFDDKGQWARSGRCHTPLLERLLNDAYFAKAPPKSTGREYFHLDWLATHLANDNIAAKDVQATLLELSARSIANALPAVQGQSARLILCGGGSHNAYLVERLSALLPAWTLSLSGQWGIDGDDMEALAFAWLGYRRVNNLPNNLPSVTGASRALSLGVIYPAADKPIVFNEECV